MSVSNSLSEDREAVLEQLAITLANAIDESTVSALRYIQPHEGHFLCPKGGQMTD